MRILVITMVMAAVLLAAGPAQAQDPCKSTAAVSCPGMRVSTCPKGDFEHIRDGCGTGADYIEIFYRNPIGEGIAGVPPTDYWIDACDEQYALALCVQHIVADSVTSVNGRTTFSGRIAAGGCIPEGGIYISCQGMTVMDEECIGPICLDVVIVGPDLIADGQVNLSDLSVLGWSLNTQAGDMQYSTCCDFNDDGMCNLSDFSFFGQHYQHECF